MNHVDYVLKRDVYPQKIHSCSKDIRGISVFVLEISAVHQKIYHRYYCMGIPVVKRLIPMTVPNADSNARLWVLSGI